MKLHNLNRNVRIIDVVKETETGKALTKMKSADEDVSHKTHDRKRTNTGCTEEEHNERVDDTTCNQQKTT